jgi:hypothetical protein
MYVLRVEDKGRKLDEGFFIGRDGDDVLIASADRADTIKTVAKQWALDGYKVAVEVR